MTGNFLNKALRNMCFCTLRANFYDRVEKKIVLPITVLLIFDFFGGLENCLQYICLGVHKNVWAERPGNVHIRAHLLGPGSFDFKLRISLILESYLLITLFSYVINHCI